MRQTNKKKNSMKQILIYIFLAVISAYFILTMRIIKPTYIDIRRFDLLLCILIIVCYFIMKLIMYIYNWIFSKLLNMENLKKDILINSIFIFGLVITIALLLFFIPLNYFLFKIDAMSFLATERDLVIPIADNILLPILSFIPYVVIFGIVGVLFYQIYYLNREKVPFFKSVIAPIVSMIALLWLLYILVRLVSIILGVL